MNNAQLQSKLSGSALFAGAALPPEILTEKTFSAGQIIGDCPNGTASVGLIVTGNVAVYSVSLDGKDVQINSLSAGDCFGICNLYAKSELETVLRCATATELLYIPKSAVMKCISTDAAFAARYAALCNRKIQFLLRQIELLTMQSCRGRVIAYLLSHQDVNGCVICSGSREDLARRLDVSRASLFRELSALQTQGAIRIDGNTYTLLDATLLENLLYHPSN